MIKTIGFQVGFDEAKVYQPYDFASNVLRIFTAKKAKGYGQCDAVDDDLQG
ncbi:MAG: hypothetical protein ACU837_10675 [Gammaproteobacteria bacterium]